MTENTDLIPDDDGPISFEDLVGTDLNAEEDGKWFLNIFEDSNPKRAVDVKLRRLTSKASGKANRDAQLAYRKYWKNGKWKSDDVMEKVGNLTIANGCIVDWRGIIDKDKKPIPCTPETALALLEKFRDFRIRVVAITSEANFWRVEQDDATVGN